MLFASWREGITDSTRDRETSFPHLSKREEIKISVNKLKERDETKGFSKLGWEGT